MLVFDLPKEEYGFYSTLRLLRVFFEMLEKTDAYLAFNRIVFRSPSFSPKKQNRRSI
jgi:hypothetical protein